MSLIPKTEQTHESGLSNRGNLFIFSNMAERVGFESSDMLEIKELRGSSQSSFPSKVKVRSF